MTLRIRRVVKDMDWQLLRTQKAYCMREAKAHDEARQTYDGMAHMFDEIQNAAVRDGIATAEEVFGTE